MIINFKVIKKKYFKNFIFILFLFFPHNLISDENRIIFKINENVFTLLDLEKRYEYLDFVGSNADIDKNIIIDDLISANLFYEYYKRSNIKENFDQRIEEIYQNILNINNQNNKTYSYKINKELILNNIKIDFIRKTILENLLNTEINNINTSNQEIDLLYSFKIKYINFNKKDFDKFNNEITNFEFASFNDFKNFLNNNNIDFFIKESEIDNINNINNKIRENILLNNNFIIIQNNKDVSVIFIEKSFETLNGLKANLYSVRTKKELDKDFLKCENLFQINDNPNIINKEYKLIDLNDDLKKNLININDYVKYQDNESIAYIILCNLKFDKDVLEDVNLNKLINSNIIKIEKKFVSKYSKIYNLTKFYE